MPADIRVSPAARSLALPLAPAFLFQWALRGALHGGFIIFGRLEPQARRYTTATGWNRNRDESHLHEIENEEFVLKKFTQLCLYNPYTAAHFSTFSIMT